MSVAIRDTVPAQFLESVRTYGKPDAFRHKRDGRYVDISHSDVFVGVRAAVSALQALKVARGDRVAIISENRIEWAVTDLAILSTGAVTVPIYPTLIPSQTEYIMRDAEVRVAFVSSREQAEKLAGIRSKLPHLEHVITFDADGGDGTVSFDHTCRESGEPITESDYERLIGEVSGRDWASIIYTSGTTGEPKGTILSHGNVMTNVHQCLQVFELYPTDISLSFLPLSHVFERVPGFFVMMTAGVTIAYAESIERVPDNLGVVKPTVVCSVPRVYEKMYARTLDTVAKSAPWRRRLFAWGRNVGRAAVERSQRTGRIEGFQLRVARALVFKKLQQRVGGRLRFFISGGAPLSREIAEFFWAAGLPVLEGYGLTETSPVIAVNTFSHRRFGSVGRALPGVEVRIAADGEILARGDNVMQGYFRKPEATDEALAGGWFHTGDIGHVDEDGYLFITDRKKDLIATAGGKKMAPQPVENRLKHSKFIAEAVLVGNRRPYISLLIVPNFESLEHWAGETGIGTSDRASLVQSPAVREIFQKIIDVENQELSQFERIKVFSILQHELTVEDGYLTPTLKVRRKIVEEGFREQIDAMYRPAPVG
jgi:long-chain acyl-CoA synthetase